MSDEASGRPGPSQTPAPSIPTSPAPNDARLAPAPIPPDERGGDEGPPIGTGTPLPRNSLPSSSEQAGAKKS